MSTASARDEPVRIFREYGKKLYDSGLPEFAPCPYCNEELTRRDVGERDIAIEVLEPTALQNGIFSLGNIRMWHKDCCPCQTDQARIQKNKLWQYLDVRFYDKKFGMDYPGAFIGSLVRCPFCFRIFDDDGTEVQI